MVVKGTSKQIIYQMHVTIWGSEKLANVKHRNKVCVIFTYWSTWTTDLCNETCNIGWMQASYRMDDIISNRVPYVIPDVRVIVLYMITKIVIKLQFFIRSHSLWVLNAFSERNTIIICYILSKYYGLPIRIWIISRPATYKFVKQLTFTTILVYSATDFVPFF